VDAFVMQECKLGGGGGGGIVNCLMMACGAEIAACLGSSCQ
jgi:hypothetical protein